MESESKMSGNTLQGRLSHAIRLSSNDGAVDLAFDLKNVSMTKEQEAIVLKLFDQKPVGIVTEEDHSHEKEKGMEGPGSKYLTKQEFESIRKLGVRLGTRGILVATICDFCLHCVKLEALPNWRGGIQ